MGKPLGMDPFLRVTPIDRVADNIWDAVEAAQSAGWTPKQFINEAKEAWIEARSNALKDELSVFDRGNL